MGKPSDISRSIHEQVCRMNARATPSEREWAQVLQDEHWWGEDPAECCLCGKVSLYKWAENGYCRAHRDQSLQEVRRDTDALIGRYDRYKHRLNFGRSLVEAALPKSALKEALDYDALDDKESRYTLWQPDPDSQ